MDNDIKIIEFFRACDITKYTISDGGMYNIHQCVNITSAIVIPKFNWTVFGHVNISIPTIGHMVLTDRLPNIVFGDLYLWCSTVKNFQFHTALNGCFYVNIRDKDYLIINFPKQCTSISITGGIEASDINFETIYDCIENRKQRILINTISNLTEKYDHWVSMKKIRLERKETIDSIINS